MNSIGEYILIKQAYQNELFSSIFFIKTSILITQRYIYTFPYDSSFYSVLQNQDFYSFSSKTEGFNVKEFMQGLSDLLINENIENTCLNEIPKSWQFELEKLSIKKFRIMLGIIGVIKLKRKIGKHKVLYTSPQNIKTIKRFLNLKQ